MIRQRDRIKLTFDAKLRCEVFGGQQLDCLWDVPPDPQGEGFTWALGIFDRVDVSLLRDIKYWSEAKNPPEMGEVLKLEGLIKASETAPITCKLTEHDGKRSLTCAKPSDIGRY